MSGHSKWETTKRQKAAVDAKRGAAFTKLANQISIAARGGADPDMNPSLAMAVDKAKAANMPKANIERAIARVSGKDAAALEEVNYEAYEPGGVGLIIQTATDNRNRTFPEVKSTLTKHGGSVAEPGSVLFQFERKGVIRLSAGGDDALMAALDAGADDASETDGEIIIYTDAKKLAEVKQNLSAAGYDAADAGLEYIAKNNVPLDAEKAEKLEKLLDALDDLDDVVAVHHNAAWPEDGD
ncbi:MAG: YebC/PmpR family DNA-binding transcriptional regulator [Candidatus Nomurabacteria bacterium]|jgi:YebC/PmpR family DNA-binding regulatory protein|nr:YebC/PmpR family DNA-binding transcriptional regulator [Candidatus Nomurabacteria bacterium]